MFVTHTITQNSVYNLPPYFIEGFKNRKNIINGDKKFIASYQEHIDKIPALQTELEKKIPELKNKIKKIKTKKESADNSRTITQSVGRIIKIAALLLGYTLLGVGSLGIIPMVIECSSKILKKTYLGKLGYKLYKHKSEINSLKRRIALHQADSKNYEIHLESRKNIMKDNIEKHENDVKVFESLIKGLDNKRKTLFSNQNYLVEQISKQPDDCLTFLSQLAKTSNNLFEVVKKIDYLKNLIS